jgi:DNA helicase HerA-like ATPase
MGPKLKFKSNEINVAMEGLPFSPFEFDAGGALPIRTASQEIAEILESIGNLGEIQTTNVNLAIREAYRIQGWDDKGAVGDRLPNIEDFKSSLVAIEAQNKGKNAGARLLSFTDYELFRNTSSDSFDVLNPLGWVFNVSKYRQDEVRITAGAFILRRIYNEMFQWKTATRPRLAIVLDEAHRLSKDPTIPKIMKEGRKFGVVVLLVSQSMDDFAPQVIDNAGSKIAFRTNFPASKKVASFLQSKNSAGLADYLENLRTAHAYVSTPDLRNPKMVKMDSE